MIKYILTALLFGGVSGYLNGSFGGPVPANWISNYLFQASLLILLFVMGLSFGLNKEAWAKLRKTGSRILIIPLAVAIGSILAGLVSGLLFRIDVVASMAVSGGYGWYTLTGPMILQFFGPEWSTLGFATNFLRELLTIVGISLTIKISKYAPIASGGATTMDTTLPIIVRYCGSDVLIAAFSSGFALSAVAPVTIIAISSLK